MVKAYTGYSSQLIATPQFLPIPGREADMEPNNAGGYGFKLNHWERLHRFLILGSEGGTYYVGEQNLTEQNARTAIQCIKENGPRVVDMAREINVSNLAPKTDPQLFVLALALKHGDQNTKEAVELAALQVLRTGTHLLHFCAMLDSLGGWNRSKRRVIKEWFTGSEAEWLAYQVLKYQQRDGWSMRDALRVSHPKVLSSGHRAVFNHVCGRTPGNGVIPACLEWYRVMQSSQGKPVEKALYGIAHGLPREALPTEALNDPQVWKALLPATPPHALIRNLGKLAQLGLNDEAYARLQSVTQDQLRKARVHPFQVLLAALVYKQGHDTRGKRSWTPSNQVLGRLEDLYDMAFKYQQPTGKRLLIGVDVSGSMGHECVGTPIPCSTAAAAMAVTLARLEPHATVVQFDTAVRAIVPVTKRTGIASVEGTAGGGTDLAAPVLWASGVESVKANRWGTPVFSGGLTAKIEHFDAFVILTDNETWAGRVHPNQALEAYRHINPRAKLVCCSMAASNANVVDPNDPLQMGCAGLDASLPQLVADFVNR